MAALGSKAVGSIVKIKVDGVLTDFIVVHQGIPNSVSYDTSCNGTWLLMRDCYEARAWNEGADIVASYKDSSIHTYLNSEFLNLIDENVRSKIKQVKIPYTYGNANYGLSTKIFLLSGLEVGLPGTLEQMP